jgi:hypothetical protein
MHIAVGLVRSETAGRADFDKEKDIEFNHVVNSRENHLELLDKIQ